MACPNWIPAVIITIRFSCFRRKRYYKRYCCLLVARGGSYVKNNFEHKFLSLLWNKVSTRGAIRVVTCRGDDDKWNESNYLVGNCLEIPFATSRVRSVDKRLNLELLHRVGNHTSTTRQDFKIISPSINRISVRDRCLSRTWIDCGRVPRPLGIS